MQNPSFLTTRETRKTTRFSVRDAKHNAAIRHAPSPHGRYRTPKQLAIYAKSPGKIRVLLHGLQKANGENRNRTFGCLPCVFEEFERWGQIATIPKNNAPNGQSFLYYGTVGAETSLDTGLGCRVMVATDWGSYIRAGSVIVFRSLDLMSATIFSRSLPNCAANSRLILRISSLIGSVVIFLSSKQLIRRTNRRWVVSAISTYLLNRCTRFGVCDMSKIPCLQELYPVDCSKGNVKCISRLGPWNSMAEYQFGRQAFRF